MAPPIDLPPPPAHPELPPEVRIAGEEELFWPADGVDIQGLARLPLSAERVVLLCHPHPLYGGTMHNAIVVVLAKALAESAGQRVGWLRFNYRGVGKSGGQYDAGKAETFDAKGALAEVRRRCPRAKLSFAAYSFGTGVAYRAAAADGGVDRISLIAPSPRMTKVDTGPFEGSVQIVAAGRDQFATPDETSELAERFHAQLSVLPDADHYFIRFRREVARLVVPFAAPELAP
jgi:alpha/beta superfamily hydrolase